MAISDIMGVVSLGDTYKFVKANCSKEDIERFEQLLEEISNILERNSVFCVKRYKDYFVFLDVAYE